MSSDNKASVWNLAGRDELGGCVLFQTTFQEKKRLGVNYIQVLFSAHNPSEFIYLIRVEVNVGRGLRMYDLLVRDLSPTSLEIQRLGVASFRLTADPYQTLMISEFENLQILGLLVTEKMSDEVFEIYKGKSPKWLREALAAALSNSL